MRVLVIEDDGELAEAIGAGLRQEQMAVDVAFDGVDGLERALVTAAVTEGPAPPMVIDVRLIASTRPVSRIRSSPPAPADAGALGASADALGAAPPTALADGVPLIRQSPTTTPAAAATTATAAATQPENPGMPPWPQRFPAADPVAGPDADPAAGAR